MSVKLRASSRHNLPEPLKPCVCKKCTGPRDATADENRLAPFHYHKKRCDICVDFSFIVNDWILYQPVIEDSQGRIILPKTKRQNSKSSLMDFPDELLVDIASNLKTSAYKYCLALSCKRLLAIVLEMEPTGKPKLALQANNLSGPWKEQLMIALARGWIPKNSIKLCFACWRFMPYGMASKKKYLAMEKDRICHLRKKDWIDNWEVKLWFRELRVAKDWQSFICDFRLRCPMCVLQDHVLRLRSKKFRERARNGKPLMALESRKSQATAGCL